MLRFLANFMLSLVLVLAACGERSATVEWEFSLDTLAGGTLHAINTPPTGETPGWQLVEDLRVGAVDGDGATTFGGLLGLVVLEDGGFAVLERTAQEVRVFGPDGSHRATHGRKGDGPGEFNSANALMRAADGRLIVPDSRNQRISVLDPSRGFMESHSLQFFVFASRGAVMTSGEIWLPSVTLDETRRDVMRVFSPEMAPVDSLSLPERIVFEDPDDPPGAFTGRSGTSVFMFGVPFFPQRLERIDPSGAVWSTAYGDPSYRLYRWVPGAGDTTLVLETHRHPVEVPTEDRDSAIEAVIEQMRPLGAANQDVSKVPTIRPAITSMLVADTGELWVLTPLADGSVYDVFDRRGRRLRTIRNTLNLYDRVPPQVVDDVFWAIVTDEFDIPYVVRARIEPVAMAP